MKQQPSGLAITRRRAIQGAASLVGGAIAAAQVGPFMSRAAVAAAADAAPEFLDAADFALVERLVDVMIPETDTPGAVDAGVHYFIDLMLAEWATPGRQARFRQGLRQLADRLRSPAGEAFVETGPDVQFELLRALDAAAFAEDADGDFYREFKRLVLFGYYSSEAGATLELQYEALQPDYKACEPLEDVGGRAWYWQGFSHGL